MIYVDDSLINEYNQPSRDIRAEIGLYIDRYAVTKKADITLNNEQLMSMSVKSSLTSSKELTLGNISTKQLSFKMLFDESLMDKWDRVVAIKAGIGIKPKGGQDYIMTTLGIFYLDTFQSTDGFHTMDITAYDIMKKLDEIDPTWYPLLQSYTRNSKYFTTAALQIPNLVVNRIAVDISRTALKAAEPCDYNSDGSVAETAGSYGVSKENLVFIPAMVNSIILRIHCTSKYTSPLKVCFYNDFYGNDKVSLNGYKEYTGYSFETKDDRYILIQKISKPGIINNLFPLYMGFSISGSDTQGETDTYEIQLEFPDHTPLLDGITDLNWEELSTHTPREMIMYGLATLGVNLVCSNDRSLYPGVSLGTADGSTPDNEEGYSFADVRMIPYQETGFEITPDIQYMSEFKTTQYNPLKITYITSGSQKTPVTATNGAGDFGFNFVDTMFTDNESSEFMLQSILARYSDLTDIMPGTIKYRGNPFVEIGDIIIVKTKEGKKYNFIIGENEIRYSGGLSCTISSKFEITRQSTKVSTSNTRSITQAINEKETNVLNKINALSGSLTELWSGQSRMGANDYVTLSAKVNEQPRGVILQWQLASSSTEEPYGDATFQFILKGTDGYCLHNVHLPSGAMLFFKRVEIATENSLHGHSVNVETGTAGGVPFYNDRMVLVKVYSW